MKTLWAWMTAVGLAATLAVLAAPLGGHAVTTQVGVPTAVATWLLLVAPEILFAPSRHW